MQSFIPKPYQLTLFKPVFLLAIVFSISACSEKSADSYLEDAKEFTNNGNQPAAIVALKNTVQLAPQNAQARYLLGKIYLDLKDFDNASKELSRAFEYGYSSNNIVLLLAEAFERSGANVALSELSYDPSTLEPGKQLEVAYRKIKALILLNQNESALMLINTNLILTSNSPYKDMIKAQKLVVNKEYLQAIEMLEGLSDIASTNLDILSFTAAVYSLNDKPEKALVLYKQYVELAPYDIEAKFSLATMLIKQGEAITAESYIDELLVVYANSGILNQLKAIVRASVEDYKSAKEYSELAINSGRSDAKLRVLAGVSSFQERDYLSAIKHLSAVAESLPDNHPAFRILAESQLQLNRGANAGITLSRINNINADDLSLFSRAGYELIKSGDNEAAKQIIKKAEAVISTPDELALIGLLKISLDDLDGIIDLEGAVANLPKSGKTKATLASAYLRAGQFEKAFSLARQWQKDEPASVEGYLLEADLLIAEEKYDEAATVISKSAYIDANDIGLRLMQIRLAIRQSNNQQALNQTKAFLLETPFNVSALATLYQLQERAGDPDIAIEKILEAANSNPKNEGLALLAAQTLFFQKRPDEALTFMQAINANKVTSNTYWEVKGSALLQTAQYSKAQEHFSKWLSFFPGQEKAIIGLLHVLDNLGEYSKGVEVSSDFLSTYESSQVQLMEPYFLILSGDARAAKKSIMKVADEFQTLPFIRGVKARIALDEGRGDEAVTDASASFFAVRTADNLLVYMRALDAASRSEDALKLVQRQVKDFPNDIVSKALLAERLIQSSPNEALQIYEELIAIIPTNPVILNNAASIHFNAGNVKRALEYSEKAHNILPNNVDISDTYAQILMKQDEIEKAVDIYSAVMNSQVRDEVIILNYIEALLKNNNVNAAKRKIEEMKFKLKSQAAKDRLLQLQIEHLS